MINLPLTSIIGLGLITTSMLFIVINHDIRINLIALFCIYIGGTFLLIRISTPQQLVSIVITGFACAVVLGEKVNLTKPPVTLPPLTAKTIFRGLLTLITCLFAFLAEKSFSKWLPIPDSILFAALVLFSGGFFIIILEYDFLISSIGLITMFFGFQMVYMLLESSILVFGFFTGINLLLALIGGILSSSRNTHETAKDEDAL